MARRKFNNPWGHKDSLWFNEEKEKWSGENLGESGEKNLSRPEEENLPQQGPINVAIFPKGIKRSSDEVLHETYRQLILTNNDPSGINGWKIIEIKDIENARKKLSELEIKNLFIASHGSYGRPTFYIGETHIESPLDLNGFTGLHIENIILEACFLASQFFTSGTTFGARIMQTLAGNCMANVYANMGYSYPGPYMWNDPKNLRFVIAGVDNTRSYNKKSPGGRYNYILDGAGRWSVVPFNTNTNQVGQFKPLNVLFLNNDGTFGITINSWREEPTIAKMIEAAMDNQDYYTFENGGGAVFQSGIGGEYVPIGGVITLGK